MSDTFFGFSSRGEKGNEEIDDTDYDALNCETFGDTDDFPSADWEEMHEKMTLQLEKVENTSDEKELEDRLANWTLNLIDDDASDREDIPTNAHLTDVGTNWTNGLNENTVPSQSVNDKYWPEPPEGICYPEIPYFNKLTIKKIPTVQEIESALPILPRNNGPNGPTPGPGGMPQPQSQHPQPQAQHPQPQAQHPQPQAQHPQPQAQHPQPQAPYPHHQQNGNYAGPSRGAYPRPRERQNAYCERWDVRPHHHVPPYHASNAQHTANVPHMMRGPARHHHPGQQFQHFEPRLHPHNIRPMRHHHPRQSNAYFPNQQLGRVTQPQYKVCMTDEYAGLMSPQEKQWLASIQMMQLNSHQPFQDDYYYTVYQQRHGNSRKLVGAQGQKRETLPQKPASTYKPLQFENSLGKLQIGSVTAPRKIIDMVLVESLDQNAKQNEKKSKAILLEIEQMYNLLLKIEEAFNPLNTAAEEPDIVALQEKLLHMIIPKNNEGKLVQVMAVKKGKKLVLRMLPFLLFPSRLLHILMMDLPAITRKDSEHNMLLFLPSIRTYLQTIDLKTLVKITTGYDNMFLLSNKFTVSVVANLIERADQVRDECTDEEVLNEWNNFLIRLLEATRKSTETERPVIAVDRNILIRHLTPVKDQVKQADFAALLLTLQPASTSVDPDPETAEALPSHSTVPSPAEPQI